MEFELNEEQKILVQTAQSFLKKELPKTKVREILDSPEGFSRQVWQRQADLGWQGLMLPEELGGSGLTFLEHCLLFEEMGYNLCPGPFLASTVLGAVPLTAAEDFAPRTELLPEMAAGRLVLTLAVDEPGLSYGRPPVNVWARADGDDFIIDGTKALVSFAHAADYVLTAARTSDEDNPEEGISLFLVPGGAPGLSRRKIKTLARDGWGEAVYDQVRVPRSSLIGPLGGAWPLVTAALEKAEAARAAEMVGGCRAVLDLAVAYAHERVQFGKPIGAFQAVQHHVANMWLGLFGARHLVYLAAWKASQGLPAGAETAMAKARAGRTFREVTKLGHQIFGGIGFAEEHDLHLYHRRSAAGDLTLGGREYQWEKVACALGL